MGGEIWVYSEPDCWCRHCGYHFNAELAEWPPRDVREFGEDYTVRCPECGCESVKFDYRPDRSTDLVKDRA